MHGVGILARKEQVPWRIHRFPSMPPGHIPFNSPPKIQALGVHRPLRSQLAFKRIQILFLVRIQRQTVHLDPFNLPVARPFREHTSGTSVMVKPIQD